MAWLQRAATLIDGLNERVGRALAWLILVMVLTQFALVLMRYVFGIASIAVQEIVLYSHAIVFLGAAGYSMLHDTFVRIDVVYAVLHARTKAVVNLAGTLLFLLPMCVVVTAVSWPYVAASWIAMETSRDSGGLPAVFVLKSFILVFVVVVFLQGISILVRSLQVLRDKGQDAAR